MNKYEKLLSKDPIGAFDKIKENYLRYFKTSYKLKDPILDDIKNTTLLENDNLYKDPYLEILPEYNTASVSEGKIAKEIEDLLDRFNKGFKNKELTDAFIAQFIKPGLMAYPPYEHQISMFEKVLANGKNTVITSGTGSGKTESFLLPLFGALYKEAKSWNEPEGVNNNWYNGTLVGNERHYNSISQRVGETRKPAIRAMVLYPMNALVEDQMTRLRKALDSDDVRSHFDSEAGLNGNRIYFGRYVGNTIGNKNIEDASDSDKKRVCDQLKKINKSASDLESYVNNTEGSDPDSIYISPRLNSGRTSEMLTRWDMQEYPPDIFITNFSMLSIMLMRQYEESIFEKTREWLNETDEEGEKTNIFHLIIDELHLYRGTAGTEIAYLMRMFLDAIGLDPVIDDDSETKIPNPQLRIMASSASLGGDDETQKYLEEFFGVYFSDTSKKAFEIQEGSNYEPQLIPNKKIDYSVFENVTLDYPFKTPEEKKIIKSQLSEQLGSAELLDFFKEHSEHIFADFLEASKVKERVVPLSIDKLSKKLFNTNDNALRGFLLLRADEEINKLRLPRIRFHQFFKYIDGLWAELLPQNEPENQVPFRKLMYQPHEVVKSDDGIHKVLELLRCEGCGEAFVGGNKKVDTRNGSTKMFLSLNAPDLDKIPSTNPTPMVQNKKYHEYGIFWPTTKKPELNENSDFFLLKEQQTTHIIVRDDFNATNSQGHYAFSKVQLRANWRKAFLNPFNGEVTLNNLGKVFLIEGYVFVLIDNNRDINNVNANVAFNNAHYNEQLPIEALPHVCPSCNRDYTLRKYTKSPIRSFRTGIARSNQLLSKELIYQLSGKKPKLVAFSDSRQDAADQSYGIEKEHYRDMVRFLFLESIDELTRPNDRISKLIEKANELKSAIFSDINDKFGDIENRYVIAGEVIDNYEKAKRTYLNPEDTFNIKLLIGDQLDGLLIQKLLKLGINPLGVEYDKQHISHNDKLFHWSSVYDFKNYKLDAIGNIQDRIDKDYTNSGEIISGVSKNLYAAIFLNSFGRYMDLNTESAGIGYLSLKIDKPESIIELTNVLLGTKIKTEDFVNAFLRIMGDHFRYYNPDSPFEITNINNYSDFKSFMTKPLVKLCELHPSIPDELTLGEAVFNTINRLLEDYGGNTFVLNPSKIQFKKVEEDTLYYSCTKCGKVHLHKGMGICTNTQCLEVLPHPKHQVSVKTIRDNHFISYDLLREKRNSIRLHTEELTGQTDDQAQRQLEFKGIIVSDRANRQSAEQLTKEIDMINVTTTMEVGVDIGNLEAIFQGNMPPTRYNYQQRVGRCGRRGQAYSTALTFCRGKSHDTYYYHKATDEMVGSAPVAPTLTIAPHDDGNGNKTIKLSIARRMLTKNLLKFAFKSIGKEVPLLNINSDTHGEFGAINQWSDIKPKLENWIYDNGELIENYIYKYLNQFNESNLIIGDIEKLINWFNSNLIDKLNLVVENAINIDGLAQAFAEAGYLPMFGMPSSLRVLYHGTDHQKGEMKTIDRNLEQSITEFAPGAIKTKDKGFYESVGLTIPLNFQYNAWQTRGVYAVDKFDDNPNKFDALENSFALEIDDNGSISEIHNYKDNNQEDDTPDLNYKRLVIPKAFRTQRIDGNTGLSSENSDTKSNFSTSTIFAKEVGKANLRVIDNCVLSLYGVTDNSTAEIWRINNNNGDYFKGKSVHNFSKTYPVNDVKWFNGPKIRNKEENVLHPNFIIEKYLNARDNTSFYGDIALGAKKVTEMLKIEVRNIPEELNLDVRDNINASSIKAAFYSAAFILQRVLADKLDIEPREIEISELKINPENGVPYLYLSDALANGAGFVSHLFKDDNFKSIITDIVNFENGFVQFLVGEEHKTECKTSCQKCLNSYDNAGYHHILDWRLGIGVLRLMIDENFKFGINKDLNYRDLSDLVDLLKNTSIMLGNSNESYTIQEPDGGLNYLEKIGLPTENYFVAHPLWSRDYLQQNQNAFTPNVTINKYLNYFELLRTLQF